MLNIENKKSEEFNSSPKTPYYEIVGGNVLKGKATVPGAKNAALPAIVAACLSQQDVLLKNIPLELNDVKLIIDLLCSMGAEIEKVNDNSIVCNGSKWEGGSLNIEKASKIRHSLLLLGTSLRWGKNITLPLPGGCNIGDRKHDLHVKGLKSLGYQVIENNFEIKVKPMNINKEAVVDFHYPTFGGTLNILFASIIGEGRNTIIKNAARNPEVHDVINLLNKMGANIKWVNESTIKVIGGSTLNGCDYQIMGDRITASTLISATGITRGNVLIQGIEAEFLHTEIEYWKRAGLSIKETTEGISVEWKKPLVAVNIRTAPYPGFHTDIQPLHTALMVTATGTTIVEETILDGRFNYCHELNKLGAKILVEDADFKCVNGAQGQRAIVEGVSDLKGGNVSATDIRGGAAVVLAALTAQGKTIIENVYQIERGYNNLPSLLSALGGTIKRINK